ncbi:MAG TPA: HlyD family efflux transporter periplasmic adaptor subunit [Kofleriaceae bacterium]|nr:HlyD family efflux transporter periplasmic adaptor subunit [Kofleriaceae bacterium]
MNRALVALVLAVACNRAPSQVSLVDVRRADLVLSVEVNGELEAVDSTDIKPPSLPNVWNYKIANLATEGADLKQGELAAAFDPSELMRELETLQNDAEAAKKKLDKKRDDAALARRNEELEIAQAEAKVRKASLKTTSSPDLVASVEQKVVELDEQLAKLELQETKAKAEQAARADTAEIGQLSDHHQYLQKRVDESQANIAKLQVTAPRAGTVVMPTNWRGEKKKVGDPAWRGEAVVQVVGLGKMRGAGQIDEIDIARVSVGQQVVMRLDALPDVQLKGTVESIAKSVAPHSNTDPSNIVKVKIAIDPSQKAPLRPGMRFRGDVETGRLPNVVQVPAEAVFVTPDGPVAYKPDGSAVKLKLGKRNATAIEVVSGLDAGQQVSRIDPTRSAP